jgi:hypothetical protein
MSQRDQGMSQRDQEMSQRDQEISQRDHVSADSARIPRGFCATRMFACVASICLQSDYDSLLHNTRTYKTAVRFQNPVSDHGPFLNDSLL